jgi:hypothetical protein
MILKTNIMKNLIKYLILLIFLPYALSSQNIENIEFISPFNEGVAAIKKGNQWAFINLEGNIIIDFRNDLALTHLDENYPIFKNDRCLITIKKEGISYYGYIDKTGKTVIQPNYLNATHFNNSKAIVLKLIKNELGNNDALDKKVVDYDYLEVIINTNNEILNYISEPIHITLSKEYVRKPPEINSKILSDNLFATINNNTWIIQNIK